jgi:hypothetical protein
MPDAWIEYDQIGNILGIHWNKPDGLSIEIPIETAEKFVLGELSIINHRISDIEIMPTLEIIVHVAAVPIFWALQTLENMPSDIEVEVNNSEINVHVPNGLPNISTVLHATLKDDPTWLIKSWKLNEYPLIDNIIKIYFEDADQYSIYVSHAS